MWINTIKFKNPAFVKTWFFLSDDKELSKINRKKNEVLSFQNGLEGRFRFQEEMDYCIVQFWITNTKSKNGVSLADLREAAQSVWDLGVSAKTDSLPPHEYLISDHDISKELSYSDPLLYDIYLKKLDDVYILYSSVIDNEFLVNFTKHLFYFHLYYGKIIRFYDAFKRDVYPGVKKTHADLIRTCSSIMDSKQRDFLDSDVQTLSNWSLSMDEMNFALQYDMESIESNLSNMKSRIRSLGAESSRYFQNHIEKAEFVLNTFDKVRDKNELIKETILKNGIAFVASRIETKKLANESERIYHIKNIKEILSWLAFIEIFINGLAESVKIYKWEGILVQSLSSTSLMRMIFLSIFLVWYGIYVIYLKVKSRRKRLAKNWN